MEKYTNKKKIGNGAYGTIIHAIHEDTKQEVIIKHLSIKNIEAKLYEQFLSELRISKKLQHKNIVSYIESYKNEESLVLIYEYCNGNSLRDYMKEIIRIKDINEREIKIKNIAQQLKNALQELYIKNIIHRDLKPDNILFNIENDEMILKLADFGFSRLFDVDQIDAFGNAPLITTICGTPIYMAPELLLKETYNIKADLWSVGVILYEMMYGYVPFYNATSIKELRNCATKNEIQFGQKLKYSYELVDLVKSLLIADSTKRIDFMNFFNHEWFNEQIFYSIVSENNNEPLQMTDSTHEQEDDNNVEKIESQSISNVLQEKDLKEIIMVSSTETIDLREYFNESIAKKLLCLLKRQSTYVYNIANEQYIKLKNNSTKTIEIENGWLLIE
jgi:serine/threonine protein kinase